MEAQRCCLEGNAEMSTSRRGAALATTQAAAADGSREFVFTDADFRELAQIAYLRAGIALSQNKHDLVYSRVSRRLRALGMSSFREYREALNAGDDTELERFINAISTNHTKFFREDHHLFHFKDNIAAPFARGQGGRRRLRVWSAGCSSGEEPYSIAVILRHEISDIAQHDVRILATDIDTDILQKASCGDYQVTALEEIPDRYRKFLSQSGEDRVVVDEKVRSLITFRRLNLIESWPVKGPFDAIFCRNVMIYFDQRTKTKLIERFTSLIRPGGWLYIGHSESLIGAHPGLSLVGRTIYRREP
jgi:chemotaxis protein methyltransferase CheR